MLNIFNYSDRALQWMINLGYLPKDQNLYQHHFQTKDAEYKELIKKFYTEGKKQIFNKLEQSEPAYPSMHCDEYAENEKKIVLQYMEYSKYQESKLEYKMIEMDSQRTSTHNDYFQQKYPEVIEQLFYTETFAQRKREGKPFTTREDLLIRILFIYTQQNFDQGCSYQSGMTYILAPLVYVIEKEADAFFCFSLLMNRIKEMYILKTKSDCINKIIATFDNSLKQKEPQIFNHLEKIEICSTYYCVTWFLTCFSHQFDFEIVLLIWDKMLKYQNIQEFQIEFTLQIFSKLREQILKAKNFQEGMKLLNGRNEQFQAKVLEVLKK